MICRVITRSMRGGHLQAVLRLKSKKVFQIPSSSYHAENVLAAASILQDNGPFVVYTKPKCTGKTAFSLLHTTRNIFRLVTLLSKKTFNYFLNAFEIFSLGKMKKNL